MLISQTNSNNGKSISFAHFASNPEKKDLPILEVLGWDSDDTGLKIDYVTKMLREKLVWPDNPADSKTWREQWRSAFTLKNREVIQSSKDMAEQLGQLALAVRNRLRELLAIVSEKDPIRKLMLVLKENLISDLDDDSFSDMYAQTIAYGLLSARIVNPKAKTVEASYNQIPITNPFLRELMETFLSISGRKKNSSLSLDFDELGINKVVDLLDRTNIEAVLQDFGDRNQKEDPVIHFFEGFLDEYDKEIRKKMGVWYTPQPLVSFIVRSVDEQLRSEFGLENGLADTTTWEELIKRTNGLEIPKGVSPKQAFVQILDPATGTGTFLVEVIDHIYNTMISKWKSEGNSKTQVVELWNKYVPEHLLPRLHGYELMMAPYAIAHMKVGLKLYETGYHFASKERAHIYLTNALEPANDFSGTFSFAIPALAHEANAANKIKSSQRITVVIGNPPYSGISSNNGEWIQSLLKGEMLDGSVSADYYAVEGERIKEKKFWLQDDYVKFIRASQFALEQSGAGILGFVTNHGYLENPTFRGMRWQLMRCFNQISVIDLHGNLKKNTVSPDGSKDSNVFLGIQQGVSIGLFTIKGSKDTSPTDSIVSHKDLWGERDAKYKWLNENSCQAKDLVRVKPAAPFYFFSNYDDSNIQEYRGWDSIEDIFPVNGTGIVTSRDHMVIDFDKKNLLERIINLRNIDISDEDIRDMYFKNKGSKKYPNGDSREWKLPEARKKIQEDEHWDQRISSVLYRPFDTRYIYYVDWMVDWPRNKLMSNMLSDKPNLAIITSRMTKGESFRHVQITNGIVEAIFMSPKTSNNAFLFPLYIEQTQSDLFNDSGTWRTNINQNYINKIQKSTGLVYVKEGANDYLTHFDAEALQAYIFAILHSNGYRERYKTVLTHDYPRIPSPISKALFSNLVILGQNLIKLQLLETIKLTDNDCKFIGSSREISKVGWTNEGGGTVWINGTGTSKNYKKGTSGFCPVPRNIWEHHIGGYQVCEKWLKDRGPKKGSSGRILTNDDIEHYQKIVFALHETIIAMNNIDKVIDQHGSWPDAFME